MRTAFCLPNFDLAPHRQLAPHWALQDIVRVGQQRSFKKSRKILGPAGRNDSPKKKKGERKKERGEQREKGRSPPQFPTFLHPERAVRSEFPIPAQLPSVDHTYRGGSESTPLQRTDEKEKEKRPIRPWSTVNWEDGTYLIIPLLICNFAHPKERERSREHQERIS